MEEVKKKFVFKRPILPKEDGRAKNGKDNDQREQAVVRLLNGGELSPEEQALFPCSYAMLQTLRGRLVERYPNTVSAKHVKGMGHCDILLEQSDGTSIKCELKVSKSAVPFNKDKPWSTTVQFLQTQLKAKSAGFLEECGVPMIHQFYERCIRPMTTRLGLNVSLEEYMKAMWDWEGKGKNAEADAAALIDALRTQAALSKEAQKAWLELENEWFRMYSPNTLRFEERVREIFNEKNEWIVITKAGVNVVPKIAVVSLTSTGPSAKPKGGTLFTYILRLRRVDGSEYDVPIVLKWHWKNGGQGVQNLNIMTQ